jgi:hypothetical protein
LISNLDGRIPFDQLADGLVGREVLDPKLCYGGIAVKDENLATLH